MVITDVPSFPDYLSLKAEILALKAKCRQKDKVIERLRRKCGVKSRTSKTEVIKMLVDGHSVDAIASAICCKKSTVYRIRKQIGLSEKAE